MLSREKKLAMVAAELAELERVGKQPFQSFLPPHLVSFDLSVIHKKPPVSANTTKS